MRVGNISFFIEPCDLEAACGGGQRALLKVFEWWSNEKVLVRTRRVRLTVEDKMIENHCNKGAMT